MNNKLNLGKKITYHQWQTLMVKYHSLIIYSINWVYGSDDIIWMEQRQKRFGYFMLFQLYGK